jgi:hypothetical protein
MRGTLGRIGNLPGQQDSGEVDGKREGFWVSRDVRFAIAVPTELAPVANRKILSPLIRWPLFHDIADIIWIPAIGGAVYNNLADRDLADHRLPPSLKIDRQRKA